MYRFYGLILLLALSTALAAPGTVTSQGSSATPAATSSDYKIVGYFVQWGMYSRNYRVKQVHTTGSAAILTHINYAFANVSTDSRCYEETRAGWGDSYADYEVSYTAEQSVDGVADVLGQPIKGHFNQLKKLKAMYPHLKVMLSIGGWTWSGRFSDAALPQNREAFVKSCIDLFIRGNLPMWAFVSGGTPSAGTTNGRAAGVFDGIDIDWEFPAVPAFPGDPSRNIPPHVYRPEDTQNFTELLAEFRRQLDLVGKENGEHYLLTIAAPPDEARYSKFELGKIHPHLDFINIMAYDINGAWNATGPTNFHAPLYVSPDDPSGPEQRVSIDTAVSGYLKLGVPASKIVVGVPFYGRGWTGVPNKNNGLYQSADSMKAAPATFEAGIEDYKKLKALNFPSFRDPKTQAFWIYDGTTFWNYDDPQAVAAKMDYIKTKGLGGAMFWSLDGDDGTLIAAIAERLKPGR
jgi:chitinase